MQKITVGSNENKIEISTYDIGVSIGEKDLAEIIDTFLNRSGRFNSGEKIGLELRNTHRTLQRLLVEFSLGILKGISQQEHSDARNAEAIAVAKKITKMQKDGELNIGAFI